MPTAKGFGFIFSGLALLTCSATGAEEEPGWSSAAVTCDNRDSIIRALEKKADRPGVRRPRGRRMPGPVTNLIAFIPDPDAEPESWFGQPKASGSTLVAGAHGDDHSGLTDAGTAYVFVRSGNSWILQQELTAFDAASGDGFGYQVEIFGDTIAVGAPGVDHSGIQNAGAVYVYTRSGNTWTLQQKLTASSPFRSDFGRTIGLERDTLVVGTWATRAYVFTREGDTWSERHDFSTPDPDSGGIFGGSVAINGDTILVGDGFAYDTGSVYVYGFDGTSWVYEQELTASDAGVGDHFGDLQECLSVSGNSILIGSPMNDHSGYTNPGAAYLFTRVGETWVEQEKIISAAPADYDAFGNCTAISREGAVIGAWGPFHYRDPGLSSVSFFTVSEDACTLKQRTEAQELGLGGIGWHVALWGNTGYADGGPSPTNPDIGAIFVFELPFFSDEVNQGLLAH